MADPVEVVIPLALLNHLKAFAEAQSPVITIAKPNEAFTPPNPVTPTSRYLRAIYLPVQTTRIISGPNTHSGLLQVDVFQGIGAGEATPGRVAAALIEHFKDQSLSRDGFVVHTKRRLPYRTQMNIDGAWSFIPVRIPYDCHEQ